MSIYQCNKYSNKLSPQLFTPHKNGGRSCGYSSVNVLDYCACFRHSNFYVYLWEDQLQQHVACLLIWILTSPWGEVIYQIWPPLTAEMKRRPTFSYSSNEWNGYCMFSRQATRGTDVYYCPTRDTSSIQGSGGWENTGVLMASDIATIASVKQFLWITDARTWVLVHFSAF